MFKGKAASFPNESVDARFFALKPMHGVSICPFFYLIINIVSMFYNDSLVIAGMEALG